MSVTINHQTNHITATNGSVTTDGRTGSNLIINGAMQVAQRGTSSTSTGFQTVDRFRVNTSATDELALTQAQDSNAPDGFTNSFKVTVTTPETSFTTTEWFYTRYTIEGQDAQQLKFGTSSALQTTLSFWVKSSVTGTYAVLFFNDQGSARGQTLTYTINSANTWEYKTIVFDGDTAQNFANSNAAGPDLYFTLSAGPDRKTTDGSSWQNYSNAMSAYGQTADVGGTASATWQITGVQLEVGDTATPFEHRSYSDQLQACKRYYQQKNDSGNALASGIWYRSSQVLAYGKFDTTMRAAPTITVSSSDFASCYTRGTARSTLDSSPCDNIGVNETRYNLTVGTTGTQGDGTHVQLNSSEAIYFDAEL